jgi:hypothetical protein
VLPTKFELVRRIACLADNQKATILWQIMLEHNTPEMQTVGHKGYENVATDRDAVTKMFTDKRVMDFIKEKGIRLVGYNDVIK